MTKYEWETELKKNIHRLPKSEQDKALDYYNELFADKAETGRSESQIIAEFGNPCDVADKILAEYQYDLRSPETASTPGKERPETPVTVESQPKAEVTEKPQQPTATPPKRKETVLGSVGTFAGGLFKIVGVVLGIALSVAVWGLFLSVIVIGFTMLIGGAGYVVTAVVAYTSNVPAMFAAIGLGLVCVGIGLILALNSKYFCKKAAAATRVLTGSGKNILKEA